MNGRVYDPTLGRFLTPDPLVQAPTLSQSWNRYSYVWNNPLRNTDPSGYSTESTTSGQYAIDVQRNGKEPDVDVIDEGSNGSTTITRGGADTQTVQKKGSELKGTSKQADFDEEVLVIGKKDGSSSCGGGCTNLTGKDAVRWMADWDRTRQRNSRLNRSTNSNRLARLQPASGWAPSQADIVDGIANQQANITNTQAGLATGTAFAIGMAPYAAKLTSMAMANPYVREAAWELGAEFLSFYLLDGMPTDPPKIQYDPGIGDPAYTEQAEGKPKPRFRVRPSRGGKIPWLNIF